ncbi:hypothetical protein KI387_019573, partial [Taxus chinensis]
MNGREKVGVAHRSVTEVVPELEEMRISIQSPLYAEKVENGTLLILKSGEEEQQKVEIQEDVKFDKDDECDEILLEREVKCIEEAMWRGVEEGRADEEDKCDELLSKREVKWIEEAMWRGEETGRGTLWSAEMECEGAKGELQSEEEQQKVEIQPLVANQPLGVFQSEAKSDEKL